MVGNTEAEHWSVITKLFIWFLNHVSRAEKKRGEEYLWDHIETNLRIRLDCAVLGQDPWCIVWDKTCGSRRPGSVEYSCVCALRKICCLFPKRMVYIAMMRLLYLSSCSFFLMIMTNVSHTSSLDLIGNCTAVHLQPDVASLSMIVRDLWEGPRTPPAGGCLWM